MDPVEIHHQGAHGGQACGVDPGVVGARGQQAAQVQVGGGVDFDRRVIDGMQRHAPAEPPAHGPKDGQAHGIDGPAFPKAGGQVLPPRALGRVVVVGALTGPVGVQMPQTAVVRQHAERAIGRLVQQGRKSGVDVDPGCEGRGALQKHRQCRFRLAPGRPVGSDDVQRVKPPAFRRCGIAGQVAGRVTTLAPNSRASAAMRGLSVETWTDPTRAAARAARPTSEIPPRGCRFLSGIPGSPRAQG